MQRSPRYTNTSLKAVFSSAYGAVATAMKPVRYKPESGSARSRHPLQRFESQHLRHRTLALALCALGLAGALPGIAAAETFPAVISLSSLDGSNGFRIDGELAGHLLGTSVAGAGDINGDGYDDVIIGAPRAGFNDNDAGAAYVVFGHAGAFSHPLAVTSLNGSNGFEIPGITLGDRFGYSVSSAGDVNADGYSDILIGAWESDLMGADTGSSFVLFGKNGGFNPTEFLLLTGTNGFAISGASVGDYSGSSVSTAGDHNDDGFDDLIIGAPDATVGGQLRAGTSHVIFGKSAGFPSVLELSGMHGGIAGYGITGGQSEDLSGSAVSAAGDVNGDGFDDVIIGAYPITGPGFCYVVFGKVGGFSSYMSLASLNGNNGFRLESSGRYDAFGTSISRAGDINDDGFDDLIVGALDHQTTAGSYAGSSYVLFGHAGTFANPVSMNSVTGSDGFRMDGEQDQSQTGAAVSAAGDVNGDGVDDLLIGARYANTSTGADDAGWTYVVFGRRGGGFPHPLALSSLNGSNGFRIDGVGAQDFSGRAVSAAGDVNGDGVDDLIIGAPGADANNRVDSGSSYVVFGRRTDQLFANGFEPSN